MSAFKAPATPAIFDKAIEQYNIKLKAAFPWLQSVYPKCQVLVDKDPRGRLYAFPAIYQGTGKDYINLFPHENKHGNYSFWDLEDYKVDNVPNMQPRIKAEFGFIVWLNMAKVLDPGEHRNLEMIKGQLLQFFNRTRVLNVRVDVQGITEDNAKIYKGYNIKEIENQHLMFPFAGVRLNGVIEYNAKC